MPTTLPHLQKNFKLVIADNLPQSVVESVHDRLEIMCCPLCGCNHQLIGVDISVPYSPLCQIQPVLFKDQLLSWHKLYPDVIQYKSIHLQPAKAS